MMSLLELSKMFIIIQKNWLTERLISIMQHKYAKLFFFLQHWLDIAVTCVEINSEQSTVIE